VLVQVEHFHHPLKISQELVHNVNRFMVENMSALKTVMTNNFSFFFKLPFVVLVNIFLLLKLMNVDALSNVFSCCFSHSYMRMYLTTVHIYFWSSHTFLGRSCSL
jgi:hypothetical protein